MKTRTRVIIAFGLCLSALAWLLLVVHFLSLVTSLNSSPTPESLEEITAWSEASTEAVRYLYYSASAFIVTCILSLFVCVTLAFPRFRNRRSIAKMLLLVSGLSLNIYFVWTAHVLEKEIGALLLLRTLVFTAIYDAISLGIPYPQDFVCLGLLVTTIATTFFLAVPRGIKLAVVRATQVGSLVMMPLGLEVYLFDRSEYGLHFTLAQQSFGLAWFTNADLLYLSTIVFVGTTALLFLSRQHR